MLGWVLKAKAFHQQASALPQGEDKKDEDWLRLAELMKEAREYVGRLQQNIRDWNERFRTSFDEMTIEEETRGAFGDLLERLESLEHTWVTHFRQLQAKKAAQKPDHPLGSDVAAPAKTIMQPPASETAKRTDDTGAVNMSTAPPLPGQPPAPAKPTEPMPGFVAPSPHPTQQDDQMEVSNDLANQDPSTAGIGACIDRPLQRIRVVSVLVSDRSVVSGVQTVARARRRAGRSRRPCSAVRGVGEGSASMAGTRVVVDLQAGGTACRVVRGSDGTVAAALAGEAAVAVAGRSDARAATQPDAAVAAPARAVAAAAGGRAGVRLVRRAQHHRPEAAVHVPIHHK